MSFMHKKQCAWQNFVSLFICITIIIYVPHLCSEWTRCLKFLAPKYVGADQFLLDVEDHGTHLLQILVITNVPCRPQLQCANSDYSTHLACLPPLKFPLTARGSQPAYEPAKGACQVDFAGRHPTEVGDILEREISTINQQPS